MKTPLVIGMPNVCVAPHAPVSYLRNAAQRVAVNTAPLRLEQALAQVDELERALASSRQESIAACQQVVLLTETNARIAALVHRSEHEVAVAHHFAYPDERTGFHPMGVTANIDVASHDVARTPAQCSTWKQPAFSLSAGLGPEATPRINRLLNRRIRFRKGAVLYRVGDRFNSLYAIHTGSCKTVLLARDGHEQVAGYHMPGDIIGMDGIANDIHECQATALEDMEVGPLPFDEIEILARLSERFRHNLYKLLSQESARAQTLMLVLGTLRAEQRLAVFLLDLSRRYRALGYSSCDFVLRMTRDEIGSYLGLTLETVSRLFSRFQREGLVQVQGRTVKLLDRVAVSQLVDCGA